MPADHLNARSFIRTEHAVARTLAATDDPEVALSHALAAIGETLGWRTGAVWEPAAERATLRCVATWRSPELNDDVFGRHAGRMSFAPGEGLPGRVWQTGGPVWIPDVTSEPSLPRAAAASAAGLHAAFGFPIRGTDGVLGVIELFDADPREPDEPLLDTMASLGAHIGQFVQRRRAEQAAREASTVRRAILDSALDCVIGMDADGRIRDFNPAAERTFGYSAAEAIGRDMAELIVPPRLRDRHRRGLARYLETGAGQILDTRVEITGMRADGSEFPVELTVTRIGIPGPPRFTGYLRDITERLRADEELRRSRARIAEAAYAERRRIERDLHDGAQQRLMSLALDLRLGRSRIDAEPAAAAGLIDAAIRELLATTNELRELARGIHPAALTDGGLRPALQTLVARAGPGVRLAAAPADRLPQAVEATAYFLVAEALTNAARHARASACEVRAWLVDERLIVEVSDNGRGGADPAAGSGLAGLADRVAAIDGVFDVTSGDDGTTVRAEIPCAS